MIYFIAVLLTLGLFMKLSDEQELRMRNASGIRTFVYGILSFSLLVYYMKTNEVPVIKQGIDVSAIQSAKDTTNRIQDKVSVAIVSRYNNNILFEDIIRFNSSYHQDDPSYEEEVQYRYGAKFQKYGGLNVKVSCYYDSTSTFVPNRKNEYLIDMLGIPESKHCYEVSVIMSHVPSILPFQGTIDPTTFNHSDSLWGFNTIFAGSLSKYNEKAFRLPGTEEFYGKNAIVYANILGTHSKIAHGIYELNSPVSSNVQNTMNIFSAADLSQCIYIIGINTECDLEQIHLNFDVPVELLPSKYEPDLLDAFDIAFKDSTTLAKIKNNFMVLYCKFPTLQNIQIVRQLVLTTILTALLALFFSNTYYFIRKQIHRKKIVSKKLGFLTVWKLKHYWDKKVARLIMVVFSLIGILTLMRALDYSILINVENILYIKLILISVLIIIVVYFIIKLKYILSHKYVKSSAEEKASVDSMIKEIYENKVREYEEEEKIFSEHIAEFGDTEIEESDTDLNNNEDNKA